MAERDSKANSAKETATDGGKPAEPAKKAATKRAPTRKRTTTAAKSASGAAAKAERPAEAAAPEAAAPDTKAAPKPASKPKAAEKAETIVDSATQDTPKASEKAASTAASTTTSAAAKAETAAVSEAAPKAAASVGDTASAAKPAAGSRGTTPPAQPMVVQKDSGFASMASIALGLFAVALALTHPMWTPGIYDSKGGNGEGWVTPSRVSERLTTELAALNARIDGLAATQAEFRGSLDSARLPGILMISGELSEALAASRPFERELSLFHAVAGETDQTAPIIAALKDHAGAGVMLADQLVDEFDGVVHSIIASEQKEKTFGSLAEQMRETISGIAAMTMRLRWRLDGAPTGNGVQATTARAETLVKDGKFDEAIAELETLPEDMKPLFADWVSAVRARQVVVQAQQDLEAFIIGVAARLP